jgi:SAM-dependent methyltransferase
MAKKKFLHVGCGKKRKDSTTNVFNTDEWKEYTLDIDPSCDPNFIGTMTDLSMIDDETFDAIYSSHNIEHLYIHEAMEAVKEFRRVLKKDGYVMIICPDLISTCEEIIKKGPYEPLYYVRQSNDEISKDIYVSGIDILYGWRPELQNGNYYMAHNSAYNESGLIKLFEQNNFQAIFSVTRKNFFDIQLLAFKNNVDRDVGSSLLRDHIA